MKGNHSLIEIIDFKPAYELHLLPVIVMLNKHILKYILLIN